MNSHCTHCTLPTIEYCLTCKTCPSSFLYSYLHPSSIISRSWTHLNNPPPAYAIAIFNSTNFYFSCSNCLSIKPPTNFLLPIQTLSLPPLCLNAIPNLTPTLPPPHH